MRRIRIFAIAIFFIALMFSCSVGKVPVSTGKVYASVESYIEDYKNMAVSEMNRTGVPASITLAQGIIESDIGRSRLATEGNNHFGIKCHEDWSGPTMRHNDDRRNECFRKYRKAEESYRDHSDFLRNEVRYRSLFSLDVTDYRGWARGLKKAGYATNPDYANMLIRKIEEYSLNNFDNHKSAAASETSQKETAIRNEVPVRTESSEKAPISTEGNYSVPAIRSRVMENNRIQYIIVKDGDTRESIEKEFQLLKWEIARYNELMADFSLVPGQILYLQPKREKADAGKDSHIFQEGETMYSVSQKYGIKLKNLLMMNRMAEGVEAAKGEKLWLRSMKPVN